MSQLMTPSENMRAAQAGDQQAYRLFLEWVSRYSRMIAGKRLARWRINSPDLLDDFVQEILLAVHNKRHTYLPQYPVEPWVAAIIRYKGIDWLRKITVERKHVTFSDPLDMEWDKAAISPDSDPSTEGDLNVALSGLSEKQREILELAKIEGLTIEEISARTGTSVSSVKVTIHRTLKSLQKKFGGSGG